MLGFPLLCGFWIRLPSSFPPFPPPPHPPLHCIVLYCLLVLCIALQYIVFCRPIMYCCARSCHVSRLVRLLASCHVLSSCVMLHRVSQVSGRKLLCFELLHSFALHCVGIALYCRFLSCTVAPGRVVASLLMSRLPKTWAVALAP